jgi:hypothetical protein
VFGAPVFEAVGVDFDLFAADGVGVEPGGSALVPEQGLVAEVAGVVAVGLGFGHGWLLASLSLRRTMAAAQGRQTAGCRVFAW